MSSVAIRPTGAGMVYPAIAEAISAFEQRIGTRNASLARLFRQCFPNTLETTVELLDDGTSFVFTGDIPAMWLRDSSAQVRPYIRFAAADPAVRRVISGLIRRQARSLLIDPYANAFNREPNSQGHQQDRTAMGPWIWERKFELDSLCYPIQLVADYWHATNDRDVLGPEVHQMLRRVVEVMEIEQHHGVRSDYRFERDDCLLPSDTLPNAGRGTPVAYTGMVWSGFRPSDDACQYGYHLPGNMFAVVVLGHLAELAHDQLDDDELAERALGLRAQIEAGIQRYGVVEHPRFGSIYAYEVDGLGNAQLMDDANIPSLLSIPYLGYRPADDPLYRRTRAFVLSAENPYYVAGRYARGVGSPHTPAGYLWPLALSMQGLTAVDRAEQEELLQMLAATTAGTGYMHESLHPDHPEMFTRPWFAWANSLFGELAYRWAGLG